MSAPRRTATPAPRRRRRDLRPLGLTLLEVLVSLAVMAMIGLLIYGAFDGMTRSRNAISTLDERYHQGRSALSRISREIAASFVSLHQAPPIAQVMRVTAFLGKKQTPYDRLDFVSFSHARLDRDKHESDQHEVGYFASRDPDVNGKVDLARREAATIDDDPEKGGVVQVLAEDIELFSLDYFDPLTGTWLDTWDSTQPAGQMGRLPLQVRVMLHLRGGPRGEPIRFSTKVTLAMQSPLAFSVPPGLLPSGAPPGFPITGLPTGGPGQGGLQGRGPTGSPAPTTARPGGGR